ncbi:MAG: leucine-rich repeat protein [Clostridia bacterium]|nr:leucine-rich repeat protein [Clostridia bacterium]
MLSNNTYTVKVTYTYDLNDGAGVHTEFKTLELKTAAKAIPTLSITEPTKTQTSVGFGIDYRDPDAVGVINKIELVHATQGTVAADNLNVREFKNLLSNNIYTVKVSYTYNLNDGQGDHIEIEKLDIKTEAKTEPTITINNPTKTQTSVGFGVDITDIDNICTVKSVELVHATRGTLVAENISVRKFENLLSNNIYTVKVTYTYDLNDGDGVHTKSVTLDIRTEPKLKPVIEIADLDYNIKHIEFNVTETDVDNTGGVTKVELYLGDTLVRTSDSLTGALFEELLSDTEYTVKITYEYDLNDGVGKHTETVTQTVKTRYDFGVGDWEPSKGLEITNGVITGIGSCNDTDLFIDKPIGSDAFSSRDSLLAIEKLYMYGEEGSYIDGSAFDSCEFLTDIRIGGKLDYIWGWAFAQCIHLENVKIDYVKYMDACVFDYCDSLKNVEIGYVETIESGVFTDCKLLESIVIPEGTVSITGAFFGCSSLKTVVLPESLKTIGAGTFYGCSSLKSINIPEGVTTIGDEAFKNCTSLESVNIPEGVTTIGNSVFNDCSSLKNINIPEGVTTIGDEAFKNCTSLESVNIPESVTTIGDSVFYYCTALKTVTIPDGVKFMGANVFAYTNNLTVYVSAGCDTKFWKSNWVGNATVIYLNDSPETDGAVKVATFNIANGREVNYDYSLLAQDIIDSGAVIIGLQEVDMNTTRNGKQDTMKLISEAVGFEYYVFGASLENYREGQFGNAILSKYPIISSEVIKLPRLTDTEEQRTLLHAVIQIGDATVDYFVTHIQQSSATVQFDEINAHLSECETFILVGDFNYSPDEAMFGRFENSYMINTKSDSITETTVDGHDFDNIILPDGIEHEGIRVINTGHSDHYMLVVDVILNNSSNE